MRRLSLLVVCIFLVSVSGFASADDDLLTRFWKEQREAAQQPAMQAQAAPGVPAAKTLVSLEFGTVTRDLLAKAAPDECYTAIGDSSEPPCDGGEPPNKVNQAYAWGMVDVGTDIWFGTVANTHCLVLSTMIGAALGGPIPPIETDSWVCEFGGGTYDPLGDQRTPHIYVWHSATDTLEDKFADMDGAGQALLATVIGIRAAGSHDGVVLLAGPTMTGQVAMFAFEAGGNYINSALLPWTDVRKFAVLNDELYVGVGLPTEGQVLHWTGDSVTPFTFDLVTSFPGETAAEVIAHEGRLAAATWPIPPAAVAGVWISPDPGGGVLAPGAWTKIWQVSDYERDPVSTAVTGVGAMASYGGNLYWGTMHPPFLAVAAHMSVYGAFYSDIDDAGYIAEFLLAAFLGNHRATTYWMGQDVDTPAPAIDLLYGLPAVPVFTPGPVPVPPFTPVIEDYWQIVDTGWTPELGISGFGNLMNSYTWSATVNNGRLWVGTMDMTYLLRDIGTTILGAFLESEGITLAEFLAFLETELGIPDFAASILSVVTGSEEFLTSSGADLYYFPAPDAPAFPESWGGIDNYTSYGVRNMVSMGGSVYAGMANPMNLLTDLTDNVPEGGWELIKLDDEVPNTPTGTEVTVTLDDGTEVTLCDVLDPGYTVGIWLPLASLPSMIPPPQGYAPAEDLMLVGTSSNASMCAGGTMATVCLPRTGRTRALFQLQMIDDPGNGPYPGWVDITTDVQETMICGEMNAAYQDLMWQLGYNGYIGIVAPFSFLGVIPDTNTYGRMMLILLIAAAALIVIRMRLG